MNTIQAAYLLVGVRRNRFQGATSMPIARNDQPSEIVAGDVEAENIDSLIQSVAGQSIAELDRLIAELGSVREMLRSEGDRVQREIGG